MLVWSVYWPTADLRGPDLEQMNRVVNLPDDLARMRLGDGSARLPSDEELAAYEQAQQVEEKPSVAEDAADEAAPAAPQPRPSAVVGGGRIQGIRQKPAEKSAGEDHDKQAGAGEPA